jgi:hypothetical protein
MYVYIDICIHRYIYIYICMYIDIYIMDGYVVGRFKKLNIVIEFVYLCGYMYL